MLKIAIQKSGRLYEESVKLLRECGIQLNNGNKQLKTVAENFPLEVFFLRDDVEGFGHDKMASGVERQTGGSGDYMLGLMRGVRSGL